MKPDGFVGWYQLMRQAIIEAALDNGVDYSTATAIAAKAVNDMRALTNLDLVVRTLAEIDDQLSKDK